MNRIGLSKLLIGFNVIIFTIGSLTGLVFLVSSNKSTNQLVAASKDSLSQLTINSDLMKATAAILSNAVSLSKDSDKDSRDIRIKIVDGHFTDSDKNISSCSENCAEINALYKTYKDTWSQVKAKASNDPKAASVLVSTKLVPAAEGLVDKLDAGLSHIRKNTTAQVDSSVASNKTVQMVLVGVVILSNIVLLVLGLIFRLKIVGQFKELSSSLDNSVTHTFSMSTKLSTTSVKINDAVENQNMAIQEIVTALDEISSMAENNIATVKSALDCSHSTTQAVSEGQSTVEQMIGTMESIDEVNTMLEKFVSVNNTQLETIVSVIGSINDKIKVINDIVFQTKLLSFNASVEAARAGEHGKGFAVVSDEVGKLAMMSGAAAKDISDLVQSSLRQVQEIVSNSKKEVTVLVSKSSEKISLGNQHAVRCGEVLLNISQTVASLDHLVKSVSDATEQQKIGVSEMGHSMRKVENEAQATKSGTHELSANATTLKDEASNLKDVSISVSHTVFGAKTEFVEDHHNNKPVDISRFKKENPFKRVG